MTSPRGPPDQRGTCGLELPREAGISAITGRRDESECQGAGPGWIAHFEAAQEKVACTQVTNCSAKSKIAFTVPIPVLLQRTRPSSQNLLPRGTVLVQPHRGWKQPSKDRTKIWRICGILVDSRRGNRINGEVRGLAFASAATPSVSSAPCANLANPRASPCTLPWPLCVTTGLSAATSHA